MVCLHCVSRDQNEFPTMRLSVAMKLRRLGKQRVLFVLTQIDYSKNAQSVLGVPELFQNEQPKVRTHFGDGRPTFVEFTARSD